MLDQGNMTPSISFDAQATRYPVFKDVKKLWQFDYAAAERRRFKGALMWDSSKLHEDLVDQYLRALRLNWTKNSGLTEEIALKYLVMHEYDI